jgi:hypothetical protein
MLAGGARLVFPVKVRTRKSAKILTPIQVERLGAVIDLFEQIRLEREADVRSFAVHDPRIIRNIILSTQNIDERKVFDMVAGAMAIKPRSPGQTSTSISLPEDLLAEIDRRADRLGLSRSQYLIRLAEKDLSEGGDLLIRESARPYGTSSSTKESPASPKTHYRIPKGKIVPRKSGPVPQ